MELGLYTFAERTPDPHTGRSVSAAERLRDVIEEAELADRLGLDVFGVGEHHRPEFVVSAPTVVLAAIAARTERIKLTSAVTVLSSDDPVRVYEQFSTLDLLSGGRAEIMAGRGSFIESFPLFGYSLDDYDDLFAEKLDLLLELREHERITWSGVHRPPLDDLGVFPQPEQQIPIWIAVGGTPASVVRAGTLGLPMALAIIGGLPERFAPDGRAAPARGGRGRPRSRSPLSINSHGFISDTPEAAIDDSFASVASVMDSDRTGARLAADDPRAVRGLGDAARRELPGQPAAGDRQDPVPARDLRPRPVHAAADGRIDAARQGDARDRAVRHAGRSRRFAPSSPVAGILRPKRRRSSVGRAHHS